MTLTYLYTFSWGLLILAAFVGWGRIVQSSLFGTEQEPVDWGLAAGWGMVATLILGGILSSLSMVSRELLILFVVGGAMFALPNIRDFFNLNNRAGYLVLLLCIPLFVRYASAVHFHGMSCADDDVSYFPMIIKLMDTGTLIDPFSLRRLAGYGGHTFLQALVGATGSEDNAYLMDRGVALLVAFGLVVGFFKRQRLIGVALGILLVVILPFPQLNSASHLTGLALFLTLFRTLSLKYDPHTINHAQIWLLGGIVAGAGSLRAHYLFVGALAIIVYWLVCYLARKQNLSTYMTTLFYVGFASVVCLAPWMALLQMSSGTFLYPLLSGNHQPEFQNYSAPLELTAHLKVFAETFFHARLAMFLVPIFLFVIRRQSAAAFALYVGSIFGTVTMTWVFTYSDVENIHRYVAPFLNAAFIGTLLVFIQSAMPTTDDATGDQKIRKFANISLIGLLLVVGGLMMSKDILRISTHWGQVALDDKIRGQYKDMQNAIPKGAKVMAMVNHPFALDYARNDIQGVDVPGAASPDPGMPFKQGAEKLKSYLQSNDFTHVVFGDLNDRPACLYNRALWDYHLNAEIPAWKFGAPFYLDLFDNVEALAQSENVIYAKDGFHVLEFK